VASPGEIWERCFMDLISTAQARILDSRRLNQHHGMKTPRGMMKKASVND